MSVFLILITHSTRVSSNFYFRINEFLVKQSVSLHLQSQVFLFLGQKLISLWSLSKEAVIFNAGDRGGRILKTNRNFFLLHFLNVITFATPFQGRQKLHTPILSDLS